MRNSCRTSTERVLCLLLLVAAVWGIVRAVGQAFNREEANHDDVVVERQLHYEFLVDGKPQFWFTHLAGGVPQNIVFSEDSVGCIVDYSRGTLLTDTLFQRKHPGRCRVAVDFRDASYSRVKWQPRYPRHYNRALKEAEAVEYFLQTHSTLDEGYQLVASYDSLLSMVIEPTLKTKFAICAAAPKAIVRRATYRVVGDFRSKDDGSDIGRIGRLSLPEASDAQSVILNQHFLSSRNDYVGPRDSIGRPHGVGFTIKTQSNGEYRLSFGRWEHGRFLGEQLYYTSDRIYGIDISRWQHNDQGQHAPIDWSQLRITNIGKRSRLIAGDVDLPVSFVFIKATESTTVVNRYYASDYQSAHLFDYRTGTYHFFSTSTDGEEQAVHFLRNMRYLPGDFPPVLDIEPSDQQIQQAGGHEAMFRHISAWLEYVEDALGTTPVIYANQDFVKRYLVRHPDILHHYPVWVARYSEYIPDLKLLFWQLSPEGRVRGISTPVDINVFNGYAEEFNRYLKKVDEE